MASPNDQGQWGPWSKTWTFTARGPAYSLDVTLDYDESTEVGTLRWKLNPTGRAPVRYRVYGSDERGFTIADQNFQSTVGVTKQEMAAWNPWFPANFIAETTAAEQAVLGRDVDMSAANKTYYRVVAVDEQQVSGYFDIEKLTYALVQGPPWLTIDRSTGMLSGTPNASGPVAAAVTATVEREVRTLDEKVLAWGNEKVLTTATERVGSATQTFEIQVR